MTRVPPFGGRPKNICALTLLAEYKSIFLPRYPQGPCLARRRECRELARTRNRRIETSRGHMGFAEGAALRAARGRVRNAIDTRRGADRTNREWRSACNAGAVCPLPRAGVSVRCSYRPR